MTRTKIPKKASGIYQIQSKSNNKIYVGSAVNIKGRKFQHFKDLKKEIHCNRYLQRHHNKYGEKDLQFSILEFCPKDTLIEREQFWMDKLSPEFNICKKAASTIGTKRTKKQKQQYWIGQKNPAKKEDVRKKLREAWKNRPPFSIETLKKMKKATAGKNNGMYGKCHSEETKKKISDALKGENNPMWGKHHSEETKQKIKKANIGKQAGEKHPLFGKHHSEETKKKMCEAQIGKVPLMLGKHHSEETKQKMSVARILWYKRLKKS